MNLRRDFFIILLVSLLWGCSSSKDEAPGIHVFSSAFNFSESQYDWTGDFAEYKIADSIQRNLLFAYNNLPYNLSANQKSLMLSGTNNGQNIFMFIKKKITGLTPSTDYTLFFKIKLISNTYGSSLVGDSVTLKVGASSFEPKKLKEGDFYQMNIDKGTGTLGGNDMGPIGSIPINSTADQYDYCDKSNSLSLDNRSIKVRTNSQGEVWLIIGTDSSFKGINTIYYTNVNVVFSVENN